MKFIKWERKGNFKCCVKSKKRRRNEEKEYNKNTHISKQTSKDMMTQPAR